MWLKAIAHTILIVFLVLKSDSLLGQNAKNNNLDFERISELPDELNESSGLVLHSNGNVFSHNDSGGKPDLFEFSAGSDSLVRTITIRGASNHDWEELASDDTSIYVGDFGNNFGSRKNLVIYRISKADLNTKNEVVPSLIHFKYPKQKSFKRRQFHNYDCEAMIVYKNRIYLFTKNRGNFKSDVFSIPTQPGKYIAKKEGTFETEGLITGADINPAGNIIALSGYTFLGGNTFNPFLYIIYDFESGNFFENNTNRIDLHTRKQVEGLCFYDNINIYFSEEEENRNAGFLYQINLEKYIKHK
jgi:hypothetical protein